LNYTRLEVRRHYRRSAFAGKRLLSLCGGLLSNCFYSLCVVKSYGVVWRLRLECYMGDYLPSAPALTYGKNEGKPYGFPLFLSDSMTFLQFYIDKKSYQKKTEMTLKSVTLSHT